jgi:sigma-E factor negative regulatory protein RseC
MLKQRGIIVDVKDKLAIAQIKPTNLCNQCTIHKGCGTVSLAPLFGQKNIEVTVINDKGVKVGDNVSISLKEQTLLKISLLFYLLPLFSLFVGAIGYEFLAANSQLPNSEILTALAGLFGLLAGFWWVKQLTTKISEPKNEEIKINKEL